MEQSISPPRAQPTPLPRDVPSTAVLQVLVRNSKLFVMIQVEQPPISGRNAGDLVPMTFRDAYAHLLIQLSSRIRNGQVSERTIAEELGISQPHMNNVLKGRRSLSFERADLLLKSSGASLAIVSRVDPGHSGMSSKEYSGTIPLIAAAIGPGNLWALKFSSHRCSAAGPLPAFMPHRGAFGRIEPDPQMPFLTSANNLALLDMSPAARKLDSPDSLFLVSVSNQPLLRWIRAGFGRLYLADELSLSRPLLWQPLGLGQGELLRIVKGRVAWLGREAARPTLEPERETSSRRRFLRTFAEHAPPHRSN